MAKRNYFVAIPSWNKLYNEGGSSITHTALTWDLGKSYDIHDEGDYTLIACNLRSARKELRERIMFVYGFTTHTIVR